MKKLSLISCLSACLFTPLLVQADNFETAVAAAKIEIDKARAVNYEWRDSRKMLEKAEKLNREGKSNEAIKLVKNARKQGETAVAQAELQANVSGPRP